VVFIHPSNLNAPELPGVPGYAADFLLDTTRAAINLARFGTLDDYPNIRFLLSHGGGFVPYAGERIAYQCDPGQDIAKGLDRLRRLYFDTALTASAAALACLQEFAAPDHLTFGSDWPYARHDKGQHFTRNLDRASLTQAERHRINRGNAERLFPRFARIPATAAS
jgi:predicted TIM-barrel fold metal-dependent hydrolase